jgi:membrane protein YdbS with pleckstrin-like domain
MPEQYHKQLIEPGETTIFDKRHSLWEIWKNFIIGAGAIVALVFLLTTFKPSVEPGTNWGYIILISILALFFIVGYGAWPLLKRRNLPEKRMFIPLSIMVLAFGGWIALFVFENNESFINGWTTVVWIAFIVVIIGWLIYPIFAWFFAHFILTDRRVILSQGILNKTTMAIPLEQLTNINTTQNVWERVFKYGDVLMETAGEFGQQPFTNIGRPLEVKKTIFQQRDIHMEEQEARRGKETAREMATVMQSGQAPAASTAPAAETSVVERLEKLSELHKAGALSDAEFQKAKEELLELEHEEQSPGQGAPPSGGE